MRVYFDASVIIAALLSPAGGSSQLFKFIKLGTLTGIASQTVLAEVLEEDKPKKLKRSRIEIEQFIAQSELIIIEEITEEDVQPYYSKVDKEDAHLIVGANLAKCSHLVTLDKKHLLRTDIKKKFFPLQIISPKELLEEIVVK